MHLRLESLFDSSKIAALGACLLALAGCGEVVLTRSGALSRYDRLSASGAIASDSRVFVDPAIVPRTRTVRIIPAVFDAGVPGAAGLTTVERRIAANVADRAMCYELSLKYDVVSTGRADLTIRSRITRVTPTGLAGAGTTMGIATGIAIAGQVGAGLAEGVGRIPLPRVPIGLGSLTVEAEALDRKRRQRAAMIWGGAANSFTSGTRFSRVSDAYDLAGDFGQDFGFLVATGKDPFKSPYYIPNWNRIRVTTLGEAPLDPDCAAFGRAPGIDGMITDYFWLPPETSDKGPTNGAGAR